MTTICKLLLEPFHTNVVEGDQGVAAEPGEINRDDTHGLDGKPSVEVSKELISAQAAEEEAIEERKHATVRNVGEKIPLLKAADAGNGGTTDQSNVSATCGMAFVN